MDTWIGEMGRDKFHTNCHKEPTYVMNVMSVYSTLDRVSAIKSRSYML